jgi:hypothetical protein
MNGLNTLGDFVPQTPVISNVRGHYPLTGRSTMASNQSA